MGQTTQRWNPPPRYESWPLARLTLVLLLFGIWGHWRFSWNAASLPAIERCLAGMLGVFCFCAVISGTLGQLYATVVIFPFYATTVLNDWLYQGCYWLFRTVLRLLYIRRVSAFFALVGELGLFVVLWRLVEILLRRYCL
ncbi:MAG: hypothetical protein HY077_05890 [Elusimicrobia bacterium]|nr:hypothetical protein [Elusimicrobiota bacterium]